MARGPRPGLGPVPEPSLVNRFSSSQTRAVSHPYRRLFRCRETYTPLETSGEVRAVLFINPMDIFACELEGILCNATRKGLE